MKVIKVTAVWCGACLIMNKRWKEVSTKYNIETESVDVDIDEDVIEKYDIGERLPVFIFFDDDGKELGRLIGEKSTSQIEEFIEGIR
ncbi:MAG: thioredoxin family protein [Bacilli bacterium]|nr:thioredoxin family protein [Bacilli bacterium]